MTRMPRVADQAYGRRRSVLSDALCAVTFRVLSPFLMCLSRSARAEGFDARQVPFLLGNRCSLLQLLPARTDQPRAERGGKEVMNHVRHPL